MYKINYIHTVQGQSSVVEHLLPLNIEYRITNIQETWVSPLIAYIHIYAQTEKQNIYHTKLILSFYLFVYLFIFGFWRQGSSV